MALENHFNVVKPYFNVESHLSVAATLFNIISKLSIHLKYS